MAADTLFWGSPPAAGANYPSHPHPHPAAGAPPARGLGLARANSAVDMRQLTAALGEAREGCGAVRQALLSAAFRPRLPGLTKIVSKLSKEGAWRKALEVYEAAAELGLAPDTALTNAAISACDKGGRWTTALAIFEGMGASGLHRDAITYSSVISALAKGKQWATALQVFGHMQAAGVQADVVTCCSLINALERGGQWQLAEQLFLEMCTAAEGGDGGGDGGGHGEGQGLVSSAVAAVAAAATAGPLKRSYTTPSSALLGMWNGGGSGGGSGDGGGGGRGALGGLCPVDEGGSGAPIPAELDLELSLSAQQAILASLVGGRDGQGGSRGAAAAPAAPPSQAALAANLDALEATLGAAGAASKSASSEDGVEDLASAFARAAAVASPEPLPGFPSEGAGPERALSASAPAFANPFAAAGGGEQGSGSFGGSGSGSSSGGSSLARALSLGGGSGGSGGALSIAARPFVTAAPPSRLQRGVLGRGGPGDGVAAAAAAAHLRRAISCFPAIDHGAVGSPSPSSPYASASTSGGPAGASPLPSPPAVNFSFSHAARVSPNRVCCNALLAAYARAKPPQWQKALHLLAAMWGGGASLTPDVVSYNTAIKACANAFQLGRAMEVYHEMRRNGVAPNATTCAAVVGAAADAGAAEPLRELAAWLDAAPPEVAGPCANALVSGLAKAGLWDEAVVRFDRFLAAATAAAAARRPPAHSHGPHGPHGPQALLSTATFNTVMEGHLSAGDVAAVRRVFAGMRPAGAAPNLVSYNTVLAALAREGAWAEALNVLNAALGASGEGVHPTAATFTAALLALAKGGEAAPPAQRAVIASQAVQVFNAMRTPCGGGSPRPGGGPAPDGPAFAALVAVLHATGHPDQVVAVHGMMAEEGLVPDAETAARVLAAAAATGQPGKAVEVAHALQLQTATIDPAQLSPLLGACVIAGAWELAAQLAAAAGPAAAPPALNFVLRSAMDAGDFRASMDTLRLMQDQGVEVDGATAARILGGDGGGGCGDAPEASQHHRREGSGPKELAPQHPINVMPMVTITFSPTDALDGSAADAGAAGASGPSPEVPRTTSTGQPVGIDSGHAVPITPQPLSRRPRAPGSAEGGTALGPQHAQHAQQEGDTLTLADTNSMLEAMRAAGDVGGCVEVLRNMALAGIAPDAASYRAVVAALAAAGQGRAAVETVREGAAAGALRAAPEPGAPPGGHRWTLDLRGCGAEVAAAVVIAWLLDAKEQGRAPGRQVKLLFGGEAGGNAAGAVDGHAARAEVHRMLITGRSSFLAFAGLAPPAMPMESVSYSAEGPNAVLIVNTAACE